MQGSGRQTYREYRTFYGVLPDSAQSKTADKDTGKATSALGEATRRGKVLHRVS